MGFSSNSRETSSCSLGGNSFRIKEVAVRVDSKDGSTSSSSSSSKLLVEIAFHVRFVSVLVI